MDSNGNTNDNTIFCFVNTDVMTPDWINKYTYFLDFITLKNRYGMNGMWDTGHDVFYRTNDWQLTIEIEVEESSEFDNMSSKILLSKVFLCILK
jgi:hypothetical protein